MGCVKNPLTDRRRKPIGHAPAREIFANYRSESRTYKRAFELSFEEFKTLIFGNCHYCGVVPSRPRRCRRDTLRDNSIMFNGIDRVQNDRGYLIDNVVSCCFDCNRSKLSRTVDEFRAWLQRLSKHQLESGW